MDNVSGPFIIVLGIAQDAGIPHVGCGCGRCEKAWDVPSLRFSVTSLAVVDPASAVGWMFDATPDFPDQLRILDHTALPGRRCALGGV
ncbi:MAG: MBL fold metallo-hydrolase, partial [Planctomycetota bacterium]